MGFFSRFSSSSSGKKKELPAASSFPLNEEQLRDLIHSVEEKECQQRMPDLSHKKGLELAPRQKTCVDFLKNKGASLAVRAGGMKEKDVLSDHPFVMAHWESLPFLDGSFDFLLLRSAFLKVSLGRVLREAGRVLNAKGSLLLCDLHPFGVSVQKEHLKSPVGEEGMGPGFERYTKWFREAGFRLEWVREIFFDGSMKKVFGSSEEQQKSFDGLRRTPFLIIFSLKKE